MVMRAMRDSAKWVMLVLSLAFVGWLVFDWVQGSGAEGAGANPVVARVGGDEVRYAEWNRYVQTQMEIARQQDQDGMTEEESRRIREEAWNDLITQLLIQSELERLGIRVTDEEIRQAFRTSPPPDLVGHPAFQTDGSFDIQKYRQYFSNPNIDPQLLLQIEDYYRRTLPRIKLLNRLAEGIYVSEEEAWQYYRDVNETARVRYLAIDPAAQIADSEVEVSGSEIREYYREHEDEFERPATAIVNLVSFPLQPSPADSAALRARLDTLRAAIASGERSFEDVALELSGDSSTAVARGEPVRRVRDQMDRALAEAAFTIPIGEVSPPVRTPGALSLIRVDERTADTVHLRQARAPLEPSMATEDSVFSRIDRLEGIALETDLATAADSLGVTMRRDVRLTRGGGDFVPGVGPLGVGLDWAFETETAPDDLSPFFQNATGYHVLELVERRPGGTSPLEEVESDIRARLVAEKKKEVARERVAEALAAGRSLEALAAEWGTRVQESRAFRRVDFVPGLGEGTEAVGAAFGLPVGGTSGVLDAGDGLAVLEVIERTPAEREQFRQVSDQLRQELTLQERQQYTQTWLEALRERTDVVDLRDVLSSGRASES